MLLFDSLGALLIAIWADILIGSLGPVLGVFLIDP
jgi:hypothetical protein